MIMELDPNLFIFPVFLKVSMIHPIIFSLATLFLTIFPFYTRPIEVGTGVLIVLSGLPAYFLFFKQSNDSEKGETRKWKKLERVSGKISSFYFNK